jgi:hypothetical protein
MIPSLVFDESRANPRIFITQGCDIKERSTLIANHGMSCQANKVST